MNEYELWYNRRHTLDQRYLRNNERDLIRHSTFDYDVYMEALARAEEKMPDDHMYIMINIPTFRSTAKIYDVNELPEYDTITYIIMTFIRSFDKMYLYNIEYTTD